MAHAEAIEVELVFCPRPGAAETDALQLPAGSLLTDALAASRLLARHGLDVSTVRVGIWSRVQPLTTPLRDRDRIEIYRPLQVDPKEARRLRYKRQCKALGVEGGEGSKAIKGQPALNGTRC